MLHSLLRAKCSRLCARVAKTYKIEGVRLKRTFAVAMLFLCFLASGLSAQTCPTLPAPSPVLSTRQDDIPPAANSLLINRHGSYFAPRPNHVLAYVQISNIEEDVWFGVDAGPSYGKVYYNRRYRADTTQPWYWQYSQSPALFSIGGSVVVDCVLVSSTLKYGRSSDD